MILLAGLGNSGPQYESTRHNVGFMAIDQIIKDYEFSGERSKFNSLFYESTINSEKIIAIKPITYMNNSGLAIAAVKNFYKIPLTNIIVLHDDIDLALNKVRVKIGGGNGGHNGIKSIDNYIGTEYVRIRIGIGRPSLKAQVSDYVLSKFTYQELETITPLLINISDNLKYLCDQDLEGFLRNIV